MAADRRGICYGAAAYLLWGAFPVYWPLLKPAGALEILGNRIAWSMLVIVGIVALTRNWTAVRTLLGDRRRSGLLAAGAAILAVNWGTYIYGVNHHHVVETSLGYFINPLVTVLLGVLVMRERLRRPQWLALGLGGVAVAVIAVDYGKPPWIALILAGSFGAYGLIKKWVSAPALPSLTIETAVLVLPALAYVGVLEAQGGATFGHHGAGQAVLLAGTGLVSTAPLLFFGAAARALPLSTLGVLQYLAPTLQFLFGVLVFHEPLPVAGLVGFALVWIALVIFTADSIRHARRRAGRTRERPPVVVAGAVAD